jgi:hypothetical protein
MNRVKHESEVNRWNASGGVPPLGSQVSTLIKDVFYLSDKINYKQKYFIHPARRSPSQIDSMSAMAKKDAKATPGKALKPSKAKPTPKKAKVKTSESEDNSEPLVDEKTDIEYVPKTFCNLGHLMLIRIQLDTRTQCKTSICHHR